MPNASFSSQLICIAYLNSKNYLESYIFLIFTFFKAYDHLVCLFFFLTSYIVSLLEIKYLTSGIYLDWEGHTGNGEQTGLNKSIDGPGSGNQEER
jgi:hypothetical protein